MIVDLRVLAVLRFNILQFSVPHDPSTRGAFLVLGHLVYDLASEFIFLDLAIHKPVPVEALQVIFVKAMVHAHQVLAVGELFDGFVVLVQVIFQADGAPTTQGVIVFSQNISDKFVSVVEHA